uniref:Phycobiliprotein ApcE n=1 Tax=Gloeochaete wittrockiana TaxID=38269 RepID=A0A3G1IW73_9EUKA|nr:phycobillisome linker protein [Gloeochaete wittrockiana]ASQ40199.1 phycobillisome linker protein [Gloeochaete wittrockiana]
MSITIGNQDVVNSPQRYKTITVSAINQADQQDRFLEQAELNQLRTYFNSGIKRLDVAIVLTNNAEGIVSRAANKIFVGGSPISYLDKSSLENLTIGSASFGETQGGFLDNLRSFFNSPGVVDKTPPGFKPINVTRYGNARMEKSLRDLDWFLRYTTYAIVAGDPNLLAINIRGLREIIENACSSAATVVALQEMRRAAIGSFINDVESQQLVNQYFSIILSEFIDPTPSDIVRKRLSRTTQGLKLPQIYASAAAVKARFVLKADSSSSEKKTVVKAVYRQIFERDITKAYSLSISDLESKVLNGQITIREFVRALGKSNLYRKQFFEPFINSRAIELAFRHFLGRAPSSREELRNYFGILSQGGLNALIETLVNSQEYTEYFGEETVPYLRGCGEEAQESRNFQLQLNLFNFSAPFRKKPQFLTLFSDYNNPIPDQHAYGNGNDPLEIQFGAIFPSNSKNVKESTSIVNKDVKRILIKRGYGIDNQISSPASVTKLPGSLGPVVFQQPSSGSDSSSAASIIKAIYLQIIGRDTYLGQRITTLETKFTNNEINVREFVRQLAKSNLFRSLYWTPFYVVKAIEYIHRRILGRPTYDRKEINKYFDIAAKQGFYALIDAMVNSAEYVQAFGENRVPYERYVTPKGLALRERKNSSNLALTLQRNQNSQTRYLSKFIELGTVSELRSTTTIGLRLKQGVTSKRFNTKVFQLQNGLNQTEISQVIKAAYLQIFERDITILKSGNEFVTLESRLRKGEISVKDFIQGLGQSELYRKEFYAPYPNTKVIEYGLKHFLGRAPLNQAEIRFYNKILAEKGLQKFVVEILTSDEYIEQFGQNTVPYRRFPTLPAANFPNTEKLYNKLVKQTVNPIIPSFKTVKPSLLLASK